MIPNYFNPLDNGSESVKSSKNDYNSFKASLENSDALLLSFKGFNNGSHTVKNLRTHKKKFSFEKENVI